MSQSSNKGVIAVVGAGCLLGLVVGLGYLLYWAPKQKAEEARAEISTWSDAWQEAKQCLLGDAPYSTDAKQALSARALTSKDLHATLAGCMNSLKALRRGEGYSTEDDAIEDAWLAIQIPVSKLAQAQAWIAAKEPNNPPDVLRTNLGMAIDEVEAAHQGLRAAAKLSVSADAGKELAKTSVHKRLTGPDKSAAEISLLKIEAGAITYLANSEDTQYRAKLTETDERFARLSPLALRAIEGSWGMWVEDDGIPVSASQARAGAKVMAGALDVIGDPSGEGVLLHTLKEGEYVDLEFAIGDQKRSLLYRIDTNSADYFSQSWAYKLMVSDDGGQSFRPEPLPAGELWVSLKASPLGNYVSWEQSPDTVALNFLQLTPEGNHHHLLSFAGNRLGVRNWPPELCQAPNRAWWIVDGAVYTMGPDQRLLPVPGKVSQDPGAYEQTMRCTDEAFSVGSQRYGQEFAGELLYEACDLERCPGTIQTVQLPVGAKYELVHHQGKWHTLVMLDDVVAIWRQDDDIKPVQVASTERASDIYGALSWEAGLLLLAWPEAAPGPSLIRLP